MSIRKSTNRLSGKNLEMTGSFSWFWYIQQNRQLGCDTGPTRHIMLAIMLVPPFSILKSDIYTEWGTVEQGEIHSLYPS